MGDFQVNPLSHGFLLFYFSSEEVCSCVLEHGPWLLAGQLLALECWRPKFKHSKDSINKVNVWLQLFDSPLEVWDNDMILKIVAKAGKPKFLDPWIASLSRLGFARVCIQLDISRLVCPGTKLLINDQVVRQKFIYQNLFDIRYSCGHVRVTINTCSRCKG